LDASVLVHFTNRWGGVSVPPYATNNLAFHVQDNPLHVKENRALTCKHLGIVHVADMEQVHGTQVRHVTTLQAQTFEACDGLITRVENLALMVLVADCIPVLMYDPRTRTIAALHVGRAGAFLGIIAAALEQMRHSYAVAPEHLHVSLGPSIGGCCYALDGSVLEEANKKFGAYVRGQKLDLRALAKGQLQAAGVRHIQEDFPCTCCGEDYFSYRTEGKTGRMAGVIMLRGARGD